jgi:hypothetical protein
MSSRAVHAENVLAENVLAQQIILHVYADLVEKGEVQPAGDIILKSEPALEQQSARLAKIEQPSQRARLDYDEEDSQDVVGRVSLRLKRADDIDYEEDEEGGEGTIEVEEHTEEPQEKRAEEVRGNDGVGAKADKKAPPSLPATEPVEEDEMEGDLSSAPVTYDGEVEMPDGKILDKSMLTLSGKFDRRKRPGPRGKRLKSTLRLLVGELKAAIDQK